MYFIFLYLVCFQLLGEIEDSLNCTIQTIESDFKIEVNEFDGKVVYGAKRKEGTGYTYHSHVDQLAKIVQTLSNLEAESQSKFLKNMSIKI